MWSRGCYAQQRESQAWVASRLVRAGSVVIVAAVSPYRDAREAARRTVEEFGPFLEVHVDAPVTECEARDTKGLYRRAREGRLVGLTGVDDPYERPRHPFLRLDTTRGSATESLGELVRALTLGGFA